jgi:KDO2-lipid IV(A) lauroyltransferase
LSLRVLARVPETADRDRDVRSGGTWTRAQALKNALIRCAVKALLFGLDRLPAAWLRALLRRTSGAMRRCLRGTLRAAQSHAALALPARQREEVVRACFERAGDNLALSLLLRRPAVRALDWVRVAPEVRAAFDDVLARGKGAIFVSAHLGPYELVAAAIAELGYEPAIVVRESYDPGLNDVVDAHRRLRGVDVIHRGHANAGFRILRALRAGRPIGILPDLGGRVPSIPVTFLGDVVAFPIGAAELAQRVSAPLVVGTLRRRRPTDDDARDFELMLAEIPTTETAEVLTQRVARCLETAILESPGDWLWMAERHRPIAE